MAKLGFGYDESETSEDEKLEKVPITTEQEGRMKKIKSKKFFWF